MRKVFAILATVDLRPYIVSVRQNEAVLFKLSKCICAAKTNTVLSIFLKTDGRNKQYDVVLGISSIYRH